MGLTGHMCDTPSPGPYSCTWPLKDRTSRSLQRWSETQNTKVIFCSAMWRTLFVKLDLPGFPSHTKTGQSYSAIILTVWFQADHTLDHKGLWFQTDHTLDIYGQVYDTPCSIKKQSLWFQSDHSLGHIRFSLWLTWNHKPLWPRVWSACRHEKKIRNCSQLTHTLMKLQNIPQQKVQCNHQIGNKVAIINFRQRLLKYWQFFLAITIIWFFKGGTNIQLTFGWMDRNFHWQIQRIVLFQHISKYCSNFNNFTSLWRAISLKGLRPFKSFRYFYTFIYIYIYIYNEWCSILGYSGKNLVCH